MKHTKMQKRITTGEGLANFARFNPTPGENWSLCFVWSKDDTVTTAALNETAEAAIADGKAILGNVKRADLNLPIRDGDLKADLYPEFKNSWYLNAKSKFKPGLVDATGQEILDPSEIYSGCFVRLSLNCYVYSQNGNKGVGFGLNNVMKTRDGERLGRRGNPASDFFENLTEDVLA